jgi:hypothetical protein
MSAMAGSSGARRAAAIGPIVVAALTVSLLPPAPMALAATVDIIAPQSHPHTPADGWQAGVCTTDDPKCTVNTPDQFFRNAAGHPPVGFTQFIVKHREPLPGLKQPVGEVGTVQVDLPPGLSVNPRATPRCPLEDFEGDPARCPPGSRVGKSEVTASVLGVPIAPIDGITRVPVYNLVPPAGEPARFGMDLLGNDIYLETGVAWDADFHEGFTIHVPKMPFAGIPLVDDGVVLKNRLVFDGASGDGTFITTPTTCYDPEQPGVGNVYSNWLLASSIAEEEEPGYRFPQGALPAFESPLPEGEKPLDCDAIPFEPSIEVDPGTARTDSPAGAAVGVGLPEIKDPGKEGKLASSHVRAAQVTLPPGMGLNPSAANGLVACTDAQFGKGTRRPVACPPASRVGRVEIQTPPLPPDSLAGGVYVGRQLSRAPASGDAYRIFVDAESPRYGISVRLLGKVRADPRTGRLTTTFADSPQVPLGSFRLVFDGGAKAPLTSPGACGPHEVAAAMTPWSGNPAATPAGTFALSAAPGGGACPETPGERPFAPGFGAGTDHPQAGAFSPLGVRIARSPGEQELKGVEVRLPPGLTAKLAGAGYCPEGAIAAAAANGGAAEAASPSCPASSLIGSASVLAGSGPAPLPIAGKAFLAGPYRGAPLSLAVVVPATAGPFDLGSVVVRVALFVDRETAQVRAISDPIPHVYGGALLGIRSISVRLERPGFSLNPTSCSPMAIGGTLRGGGANPADPAAFSALGVSVPFQANGCGKLGFAPKLFLRLFGAMRRARNPKLRTVFIARAGDANTARAAVTLPHALFLDQDSVSRVCTRRQYAAGDCPKSSIYGYARAFTPLLDEPLKGPVHLRSSDNRLPDLVASLHGQVDVDLVGRIDSVRGRIRTTYDTVPDVPVSGFVLTIRGGGRGLLTNSRNQCSKRRLRAVARIMSQDGKMANQRPKVRRHCRKAHRHRRQHHRRRGRG